MGSFGKFDAGSSSVNKYLDNISKTNISKPVEEKNYCSVDDVYQDDQFILNPPKNEEKMSPVDEQKMVDVLRTSAKKSSEKVSSKIAELTQAIPFVDSTENGNVNADLKISVVDKNGFLDYGEQDMEVKLNGKMNIKKDVFFNSLKKIEGKEIRRSFKADVDIGKVSFDSKTNSYKIQLKIDGLLFLNDDINLVVKPDKNKNLVLSVEDKWLPDFLASDKEILSEARDAIAKELKKADFGLNSVIKDDKLYFLPKINSREIKLNSKESFRIDKSNLDFNNTGFSIDKEGNIGIELKNVSITASNIGYDSTGKRVPEKSSGDIDFAEVELSADINTNGNKEIFVKDGKVSTKFDEKESERFKVEGSTFGSHFPQNSLALEGLTGKITVDKSNKVNSSLSGKVSVALTRPDKSIGLEGNIATKFNSSGDFQIASKDLTISHPNGKTKLNEFLVSDDKDGLQLHLKEQDINMPSVNAKTTKNDLKLIIDSEKYKKALFEGLDKAKESIHIESYLYSGDIGSNVTDKLLMKAAGLAKTKAGTAKIDNSEGVKVKVMFDSSTGDKTPDNHPSMIMVKDRFQKFVKDVTEGNGDFASLSSKDKEKVIANVKNNMQWRMLEGGITKIDHRKEIIIDGQSAFSGGGINLTDSAMRKHDSMVEVWGPAVNQIQKEFLENWEEVAGKVPEAERSKLLKDEKTLTKIMKKHQTETGHTKTSNTQVLVTDDNQFETYQKMVEQIRTAKTINIEHAYFTDSKLINEIADAIKRGATVNVILPQENDEGDKLHYGNLGTLQTLKKASEEPGAGKFNAYLYKWNEKENTGRFTHTKAVSFDDKTAIVGSTNLTARSLHGTVTGFLFNKEMSLMVEDKDFVKDMNKNIFENDMKPENSIKLDDKWFKELEKEQKKIDKYTAIQPLF